MNNEDKVLSKAVEIASSPQMLSREDKIDVIIQSTGADKAIAERALVQAKEEITQKPPEENCISTQVVVKKTSQVANQKQEAESSMHSTRMLLGAVINIVMMYIAYQVMLPAIIGDRSIMDIIQPSSEEVEVR